MERASRFVDFGEPREERRGQRGLGSDTAKKIRQRVPIPRANHELSRQLTVVLTCLAIRRVGDWVTTTTRATRTPLDVEREQTRDRKSGVRERKAYEKMRQLLARTR